MSSKSTGSKKALEVVAEQRLPVTARTATPTAAYVHDVGERSSVRPRPNKSLFLVGSIADVNEKIVRIERFLYGSPSAKSTSTRSSDFTGGLEFSFSMFEDDPLLPEVNRKKAKEKAELNQFAGLFAMTAAMKFRRSITPTHSATPLRADVAAARFGSSSSAKGAKKGVNQMPLYADTHKFEYRTGTMPLPNGLKPEQIYSQVLLSDRSSGAISDSETVEMMKFLHSPPCINLLLDSFWWIFVDTYGDEFAKRTSIAALFDRIATHYLRFLQFSDETMNRDSHRIIANRGFVLLKDFPEILSKAVYCAFCNCFPDSVKQYSDAFRNGITNTIYEWICGAKPLPDKWKTWNLRMLERSVLKVKPTDNNAIEAGNTSKHTQRGSRSSRVSIEAKVPVRHSSVASFRRGTNEKSLSKQTMSEIPEDSLEDEESQSTQRRNKEIEREFNEFLDSVNRACVLKRPKQNTSASEKDKDGKVAALDSRKQGALKSYPVVKGGYTTTVQFNLNARSPLLEHCIKTKKFSVPEAGTDCLVHRAEARPLPNRLEMFTYEDVINAARETTEKIKTEHDRKLATEEAERLRFLSSLKENVAYREGQVRTLLANQKEVHRLCEMIVVERKRTDPSEIAAAGVSADEQLEAALRRQKPTRAAPF